MSTRRRDEGVWNAIGAPFASLPPEEGDEGDRGATRDAKRARAGETNARGGVEVGDGQARGERHEFEALSHAVIGACIDVQRHLGLHCMEVDYQRALEVALARLGVDQQREVEIPIYYGGELITKRRVDFVISDEAGELILETKARRAILPEDIEQCLLYLHQGNYRVCLLVNFGQKPIGVRRFVNTPVKTAEDDPAKRS